MKKYQSILYQDQAIKRVFTPWRRGVVVITSAQLHLTKPELRLCAGSNPARGVLEICDGENL